MENPIVYRNFRKLDGGGKELSCKSRVGMLASAHRLNAGLVRKAPVEKPIAEFVSFLVTSVRRRAVYHR